MKTYFIKPIESLNDAHAFFDNLTADRVLFHPEDNPEFIVDAFGLALFTPDECVELKKRIDEVYQFDADPCAYCLTLAGYA
jgi:hypothetical protein